MIKGLICVAKPMAYLNKRKISIYNETYLELWHVGEYYLLLSSPISLLAHKNPGFCSFLLFILWRNILTLGRCSSSPSNSQYRIEVNAKALLKIEYFYELGNCCGTFMHEIEWVVHPRILIFIILPLDDKSSQYYIQDIVDPNHNQRYHNYMFVPPYHDHK